MQQHNGSEEDRIKDLFLSHGAPAAQGIGVVPVPVAAFATPVTEMPTYMSSP